MKRYNITVNGTVYDVAVEEVSSEGAPSVSAPVSAVKAAPTASSAVVGDVKISAPMPGTIVDIKAKVGDSVKNGTVVAILEAMKMENDVVADRDGVIVSINVNKGDSVSTGTVIATLKTQ